MISTAPSCFLSNGHLDIDVFLPDSEAGFYRGTRFDWSGIIGSLRYRGHEYFGQWKDLHDPSHHDCITGPAAEFESPETGDAEFASAPEGAEFLRLGVGLLRKEGGHYRKFATYPIFDATGWSISIQQNEVTFEHAARSSTGTACRYCKRLVLAPDAPSFRLEHLLVNCGVRPICTRQYNHNFFQIDGIPPGPSLQMTLPNANATTLPNGTLLEITGGSIALRRPLTNPETVLHEFSIGDKYDIELFQAKTGAGVHISSDRPVARFVLWASNRVFCPEPYIDIDVPPGSSIRWNIGYRFYTTGV